MLDAALATGLGPDDDEISAAFGSIAAAYDTVVEELFVDDDDLRIDR